jgi:hypothetical protein
MDNRISASSSGDRVKPPWSSLDNTVTDAPSSKGAPSITILPPTTFPVAIFMSSYSTLGLLSICGANHGARQNYTAIIKQDVGWWICWIEEVSGVNCQERTRDELLKALRITLGEALDMNRGDAKQAVGKATKTD